MDEIIDVEDLRKLKLPELKALCKQNGIPSSGSKDVLIKRLAVSMGMDEEDEGVDEDALLEEEEEEEDDKDEEAGVSSSDDKEQSVEPSASNDTTNDSVVEAPEEPPPAAESPKKQPPPAAVEKDKENDTGVSPTKKIKLIEAPPADPPKPVSQLTDAERLKLRAEKYGVNTSKGALSSKEARAARFGLASGDKKTATEKKSSPPAKGGGGGGAAAKNLSAEDLEKMKQRSERFGATVSSAMSNVDNAEKILKRKERFGEVAPSKSSGDSAKEKRAARFGLSNAVTSTKSTTTTTTSTEMDELKKKRAERFKITA